MNIPLAPEHRVFEKDVGTWDAEIEVRTGPGAEPQRSKGVSVNRLVGGGAWLVTDYQTDSGFEGHGVYGFDQTKQKYVGTWVDTMRRFMVVAEGEWDAERKRMSFRGEASMPDGRIPPVARGNDHVGRRTQRARDDDRQLPLPSLIGRRTRSPAPSICTGLPG